MAVVLRTIYMISIIAGENNIIWQNSVVFYSFYFLLLVGLKGIQYVYIAHLFEENLLYTFFAIIV